MKTWAVIALVAFLVMAFVSGIIEGIGMSSVTALTAALSKTGTTATVTSTDGFPSSGYVMIEGEKLLYTATDATHFNNLTRGYSNTIATSHTVGRKVYSPSMGVINSIFGFNIMSAEGTAGGIDILTVGYNFIRLTVPKLMTWDFSMYNRLPWVIVRLLLFVFVSLPLMLEAALIIGQIVGGVAQSILRLI